jgi:CBS domain-containing protein
MKRNESVSQIMSTKLVTVHLGNKLSEVHALLREHKIHHVPVVSGTRFVGLLSANDLLRVSWGDPYTHDPREIDTLLDTQEIRDVMQEDVKTVLPTATVREAAQALVQGSFHGLPVVDADGDLVGLITSTDLIRYLLDQY